MTDIQQEMREAFNEIKALAHGATVTCSMDLGLINPDRWTFSFRVGDKYCISEDMQKAVEQAMSETFRLNHPKFIEAKELEQRAKQLREEARKEVA